MSCKIFLITYLSILSSFCVAQLPANDLFVLDFIEYDKELSIKNIKYLSNFNKGGYNNQPSFFDPNSLYITSNKESGDLTDIVKLDIRLGNYQFVTKTNSVSEYSPTIMPDRQNFSVIRQDGTDQWLWQYPLDKSTAGGPLLALTDVGYHCWLNDTEVALFRVTDPISLSIANVANGEVVDKLKNIGRCLRKDDFGNLIFVHKVIDNLWYLKSYDPRTNKIKVIAEVDQEDFAIMPSGDFIIGKGSKLYKLGTNDSNWTQVADLSQYGIININRMAISRNKLVIVSNKKS